MSGGPSSVAGARVGRVASTARRAAGEGAKKLVRVASRDAIAVAGRVRRPRVSIVIPAHNVEGYIEKSLRSLTDQTFKDFEVIVVDNNSTDRTAAVVRTAARKDWRIRIIRCATPGPSAARNAGIAAARGEFLFFLDADDWCIDTSLELLVGSLERSGSDIAVGSYRRFNSRREWDPALWIMSLHERERASTTLADSPDLLVSAVVWGKLYRASFWRAAGLTFVEGMLYEDQLVTAQAYARARRIDVLAQQLVFWRDREDGTSISQQRSDLRDLTARIRAARASLDELRRSSTPPVVQARLVQLLAHDFPHSLRELRDDTPGFWELLRGELLPFYEELDAEHRSEVYAQHRVVYRLLEEDRHEAAVHFVRDTGLAENAIATTVVDGTGFLDLAETHPDTWEIGGWPEYPLAPEQVTLHTSIQGVTREDDTLVVTGWAFLSNLDPASVGGDLEVSLVHSVPGETGASVRSGRVASATVARTRVEWLTRTNPHQFVDFGDAGFRAEFDLAAAELADGEWTLEARVATRCYERVALPHRHDFLGSAEQLDGIPLGRGAVARPAWRTSLGQPWTFVLAVGPASATLVDVQDDEQRGGVRLVLRPRPGLALDTVELTRGDPDRKRLRPRVRPVGDGTVATTVPAAVLGAAPPGVAWTIDVPDPDGATGLAGFVATIDGLRGARVGGMILGSSRGGRPTLRPEREDVELTGVSAVDADAITLHASVGPAVSTASAVRLTLASAKTTVTVDATADLASGALRIPLTTSRWGGPELPLPIDRYRLSIELVAPDGTTTPIRASAARSFLPHIPSEWFDASSIAARLLFDGWASQLIVDVHPPQRSDEYGAVNQGRMRRAYQRTGAEVERGTVLLRTYYGETATCNAAGLHREILARGGMGLTVRWAVQDHSVVTPGGEAVVIGSAAWYQALATSELIVENVHQVPYFVKQPGQVMVETFHGYPFKSMGHSYFESAGFPPHRIASFDERKDQWDFIVSPAPYATPLLAREFRYDGPMLELGYPRNDVLFGADRDETRRRVRRVLGIGDDQHAVLYAPTWRDTAAVGEVAAKRVDYVDYERVAAALGQDVVLLVRGHQASARAGDRVPEGVRVVDVTTYGEISDLILAADLAVLDYSSLRFDFAQTGKPMVFLVPDLEEYEAARGWLFDYRVTAPGDLVRTEAELVDAVRAAIGRRYDGDREDYRRFISQYTPLEDGSAAARVLDALYGDGKPLDSARP